MSEHRIRFGSKKIPDGIGFRIATVLAVLGGVMWIVWIAWCGGYSLPRWVDWRNRTVMDESGQYEIVLKHRAVKVVCDNSVIWTTPKEIKVQDAMSCDIDGDGADELMLLCW